MRRRRVVARVLVFGAVTLAVIALAPVIAAVGEPLRKYYLRRPSGLARAVIANPVLIALTAPGSFGGSGDGDWPPPAGVREPRRPRPNLPASAIALAEPTAFYIEKLRGFIGRQS